MILESQQTEETNQLEDIPSELEENQETTEDNNQLDDINIDSNQNEQEGKL